LELVISGISEMQTLDVSYLNRAEEMKRIVAAIGALAYLHDTPPQEITLLGPSRHIVMLLPDSSTIAKSYRQSDRMDAEKGNLQFFHDVNARRTQLLKEITDTHEEYLGLPLRDTTIDIPSSIDTKSGIYPISVFRAVPGDLLYQKTLEGRATFDDYLRAATQVARIQEEGKLQRRELDLEDVVRTVKDPESDYFTNRFRDTFLGQLTTYGNVNLPTDVHEEMAKNWRHLVAQNLLNAHRRGLAGYYLDGNPKHHIIAPNDGMTTFDFEYSLYKPNLLGLASLVSFGLTKEGNSFLNPEQQQKVIDRFLLEMKFTDAMSREARDLAQRIHRYTSEVSLPENGYDLSGKDPEQFFRFLGDNDAGHGRERREDYLSVWPFALLERNAAWTGHKARYRAIAEALMEQGYKFENPDVVGQNAAEQRVHLQQISSILDTIMHTPARNGTQAAAHSLFNRFRELTDKPYFHLK